MPDDRIAAELAAIRERREFGLTGVDPAAIGPADPVLQIRAMANLIDVDVPRLLAAVDEVLKPHAPRTDRVPGSSCFTHRTALSTSVPLPGCEDCVQDRPREVCPECRDEYGDPVLFQDCRARAAALTELTGEADGR